MWIARAVRHHHQVQGWWWLLCGKSWQRMEKGENGKLRVKWKKMMQKRGENREEDTHIIIIRTYPLMTISHSLFHSESNVSFQPLLSTFQLVANGKRLLISSHLMPCGWMRLMLNQMNREEVSHPPQQGPHANTLSHRWKTHGSESESGARDKMIMRKGM